MPSELQRAASCLSRDPRVLAVYAFGSVARGQSRPGSDLDLGVLVDAKLSLVEELRLRARVTAELHRDDVDLVVLNLAPPLLCYEVVAAGCRLFARDEERVDRFEQRSIQRCLDTAHLRATQQRIARELAR